MTPRRGAALLALAAWFLTASGQASVSPGAEVKVADGRVHIQASVTPLNVILDRLSKTTGMKVVYDGATPTDRLTVNLQAGSETEALSRLFEGLGLTYAFKLDATGRHVETLFVTSAPSGTRRSSSSMPTASPAPPMSQPIEQEAEEDVMAANEPPPESDPTMVTPPPQGPAGVGINPGSPGYASSMSSGMVGGSPAVQEQAPAFPGAASFPSPNGPAGPSFPAAPNPTSPVVPGPASYPTPNVHS